MQIAYTKTPHRLAHLTEGRKTETFCGKPCQTPAAPIPSTGPVAWPTDDELAAP